MDEPVQQRLGSLIQQHEATILDEWLQQQAALTAGRRDSIRESELREESRSFLRKLREAMSAGGDPQRPDGPEWSEVRGFLDDLSRTRAARGFTPRETATFFFSLKQPLFAHLRRELASEPAALAEQTWVVTVMLDQLGLYTIEVFQKTREEVIHRQQQDLLELSTPVVQLWSGVLALPLIGTLDSARTQVVMESLLQKVVETGSQIAIIDITGVPTVDTLVAQHLLKTVAAARLMGADCIISGIRPQIAATIVHLGVNLQDVITKATLGDAFALALRKTGQTVTRLHPSDPPLQDGQGFTAGSGAGAASPSGMR